MSLQSAIREESIFCIASYLNYWRDPDATHSCKFNPMTPLHFVIVMDYLHDPDVTRSCKFNPMTTFHFVIWSFCF